MLLVRHRDQRITIESTPFSPLWTRSWPKLRIGSVEMTKLFFVITIISTRSYFMETNACSIVSKNTCRKWQMSMTYYMKTPSIKSHQSSRRWLLFWPQHHAQRNVRSADSGGDRFTFVTPWDSIDSIASLSSVLSAPMEIKSLSTVWTR